MADLEPDAQIGRDPLRVITAWLLASTAVAVVGLIVYLASYVRDQRETSDCYQAAFRDLNVSLKVSRDAAKQDRAELRDLATALTDPAKTLAERRDALQQYVAASLAAEQDRAAAPLPTRTCS